MSSITIDFEENDFSDFDTAPAGTAYTISTAAGKIGTYGLEIDYDGTFTTTGTKSVTTAGSFTVWRLGCWLNLNTTSFGTNNFEEILALHHIDDSIDLISLTFLEDSAGAIDLTIDVRHDVGTTSTTEVVAQSSWFHVEVIATVASGVSSNDGVVQVKINGSQVYINSSVDNYNRMADSTSENVEIQLLGRSDATSCDGVYYIDHIQWNDDDTPTFTPPSDEGIYGISLAIDRENDGGMLWVSTLEDGTLYARQFDAATLAPAGKTALGSATLANVQNRTNTAYVAAGSGLNGWAYGNMVNPAGITGTYQLIETMTGVTGSWSAIALGWLDNDVLRAFHTTPELTAGGDRLYSGVRWFASGGSVNQLYQDTNGLAYISNIPLVTGSVKHGAFDVSGFYHIALGGDTLGTGANRVLGTVPPYSSWTDITNNYPSGSVEVLRFL